MSANYYKEGSHNVQCDRCGKKRKREQVKKTWDGLMCCIDKGCYYVKHPNEYPRKVIQDSKPVKDARDRNTVNIEVSFIDYTHTEFTWETMIWETAYWDNVYQERTFNYAGNPLLPSEEE